MRVKRRFFCGVVCEQEVYTVSARIRDPRKAEPRKPRFKTEEQRKAFNRAVALRYFIRLINTNCHPQWLYLTLTLDNAHEVHTFEEARRLADIFLRRLRRVNPYLEYILVMGRGKSGSRIHFHLLVNGISMEKILEKWTFGSVQEPEKDHHLRKHNIYNGVDCGMDYTGLAIYLFEHWTEEQGENSHRWRASRNLRKPEPEEARETKRYYSEERPPIAPKGFILVDYEKTDFGYQWFKYVQEVEPEQGPPPGRPPKDSIPII